MKKSFIPGPFSRPVCAGVSLLLALAFSLVFLGSNSPLGPAVGSDNAIYLTMGTALTQGYAPYTQVFDHKGPMLFILEAVAQVFGGGYSTTAVFLMEALFLWGCLLCVGTLARRYGVTALPAQLVFLLAIAPNIDGGNYCETYSNLFNLLGALMLFHVFDRDKPIKNTKAYFLPAAGAGAALMLSFLVRANNVLPLMGMVAACALCLLIYRRFAALGMCALGVIAGCAAAAAPVCLWLAMQGALSEAIYASIIHNFMYAETGSTSRMQMLLRNPYGWQAMAMAALAIVGGCAYAWTKKRPAAGMMLVFGAAMGGFAAFISHKFYSHYLMLLAPVATMGMALLCAALREKRIALPKAAYAAAALLFIAPMLVLGVRENAERAQQHAVFEQLETQTQELLAHVPEEERDQLLGYRTEPKWYVAADAMPYLRFYFLQEILGQADPAVMDEIAKTLEEAPPKWLVIFYNREFGPPYDARVQAIFDTRYEFVDARGEYQLLRLKESETK